MAFTAGNTYGVARRTVENELRKVVHRKPERLRSALERVLEDACDSPSDSHRMACISFIADRLDGRARQAVDITTSTDAKALDLAQVVQAVLAARSASSEDAHIVSIPLEQDTVQSEDSASSASLPGASSADHHTP
jgi:hypothetical protein